MDVFRGDIEKSHPDLLKPNEEIDGCVYESRKFFKLAAENNPNILDILFAPDDCVILTTDAWDIVRARRRSFLTKRIVYTFRGYAVAQIKKIERHRKWLLSPPVAPPKREDYGLHAHHKEVPADQLKAAHSSIQKRIDSWEIDFTDEVPRATVLQVQEKLESVLMDLEIGHEGKFHTAGRLLGYETNFLDLLDRERRYERDLEQWKAYQSWKVSRNAKRAELESRIGYDSKHGMHVVRLLQSCKEILESGDYTPRRANAAQLLDIRNGGWSYDTLLDFAKENETGLLEVAARSPLPKNPDLASLDALCVEFNHWAMARL